MAHIVVNTDNILLVNTDYTYFIIDIVFMYISYNYTNFKF